MMMTLCRKQKLEDAYQHHRFLTDAREHVSTLCHIVTESSVKHPFIQLCHRWSWQWKNVLSRQWKLAILSERSRKCLMIWFLTNATSFKCMCLYPRLLCYLTPSHTVYWWAVDMLRWCIAHRWPGVMRWWRQWMLVIRPATSVKLRLNYRAILNAKYVFYLLVFLVSLWTSVLWLGHKNFCFTGLWYSPKYPVGNPTCLL